MLRLFRQFSEVINAYHVLRPEIHGYVSCFRVDQKLLSFQSKIPSLEFFTILFSYGSITEVENSFMDLPLFINSQITIACFVNLKNSLKIKIVTIKLVKFQQNTILSYTSECCIKIIIYIYTLSVWDNRIMIHRTPLYFSPPPSPLRDTNFPWNGRSSLQNRGISQTPKNIHEIRVYSFP